MAVVLLDFVQKALRVAKQALGSYAGEARQIRDSSRGAYRRTLFRKEEGHYTVAEVVKDSQ